MSARATAWGAYHAIAAAIRGRIENGEFPPGSLLPSESALCGEYGVARNTLRRALDVLAADGLLSSSPGRGRQVVGQTEGAADQTPQYRRIARELRELIESGSIQPGEAIPSEAALAGRYGVSRGTARHALAELEGAGLVHPVHGKGRFVSDRSGTKSPTL
ncbi:GntR family transcriptional regulator [Actinoplanes sp. NPDC049316]|uniref:GntR family transcriptional regulator n=1 Tax=Actinoplanes sp. NPDC049316 TaxID=3154727 RepID=UPI003440C6FA